MQKSMNFLDQNRLRSSHGSRHQPSHLKEFKELLNFQRSARHLLMSFDRNMATMLKKLNAGMEAQETWKQGYILSEDANTEIAGNMFPFCWGWAGDVHFLTQVLTFAVRLLSASRTNVAMVLVYSVCPNRIGEKQSRASLHALNLSLPQLSHLDQLGNTWLPWLNVRPNLQQSSFNRWIFFTPGHLCVHLVTTCHLFSHPVLQLCVVESWLRAGWEQTIVRIDYEQTPNRHEYTTNRLGMVDQVDIKWRSLTSLRSSLFSRQSSLLRSLAFLTFFHFTASQLRSFTFTLQFDDIFSAHREKTTTTRVEAMTLATRSASSYS